MARGRHDHRADLRKRLTRRAAKYDKVGTHLQPNLGAAQIRARIGLMQRFIGLRGC